MAIGSELWENTGDNPKKTLDNYIIDSWKWPNVQKKGVGTDLGLRVFI